MDLRFMVQKAIQKNMPTLGSIRRNCLYVYSPPPDYNSTAGTILEADIGLFFTPAFLLEYADYFVGETFQYPMKVVISDFNLTETKGGEGLIGSEPIIVNDKKGLFSALDLPVSPEVDSIIYDLAKDVQYQIKGRNQDPAGAIWLLHLRPIKDNASG